MKPIIFILAVLLCGCDTAHRLQKKCLRKMNYAIAAGCIDTSTKVHTIRIPKRITETEIKTDTLLTTDTVTKYVDCPEKGAQVPVKTPVVTKWIVPDTSAMRMNGLTIAIKLIDGKYRVQVTEDAKDIEYRAADAVVNPKMLPPDCKPFPWWLILVAGLGGIAIGAVIVRRQR